MLETLLMFLLPIKHGLVAHVWDLGYSGCRTGDHRTWWTSITEHISSELIITGCLLYGHSVEHYMTVLVTEGLALLTILFIDRRIWFSQNVNAKLALLVHLLLEIGLFGIYFYLGWILSHPPAFS